MRIVWAWLLALLVVLLPGPLHAQPQPVTPEQKEQAKQKYRDGKSAFAEKRYKDAIDLFLQGDAMVRNPAFAYNVALAYEAMGDGSLALKWSREYLFRSPEASDRAEVQTRVRGFEKLLADKGVQQVTVRSVPAGALVMIDGKSVGVTPWTGDIQPGEHQVKLELAKHFPAEQKFALPVDRAIDVIIRLESEPVALPPAPLPPEPPPEDKGATQQGDDGGDGGPGLLPWGLVGIGLGAVGVAVAVGLELARGGAEDDARDAGSQVEAAALYADMESLQTGARVAAGVGAALVAVGLVLVVVDVASGPDDGDAAKVSGVTARVAMACGPMVCGFHVDGAFGWPIGGQRP